jgi:hypothetical protein
MPTDANGVYSLPAGYLAVTGETVLASQHNPPLEDIAAALTGRLMTTGVNPMSAPHKLVDGTAAAPALTFATSTSWGLYKSATGVGLSVSGASVADFTPTALALPNGLTVAKTTQFKDAGDVVSAGALTLGDGNIFNITGTTAITSIATKGVGTIVWLRFAASLVLTHHTTDFVLANAANITTAAGDWAVFEEYAVGDWRLVSYHRIAGTALRASLPRGYIDGCETANGTDTVNDINFSAGVCRDSTNTVDITCSAMVKQLDANWAAGTNAGMREATGLADGTFHLFAIMKADGTQDYFAYTAVDPTAVLPSGYLYFRHLMSIIRLTTILGYVQDGDRVRFKAGILSINADANPGTSAVTRALTVPGGIALQAEFSIIFTPGSNNHWALVTALDETDTVPSASAFNFKVFGSATDGVGGVMQVKTNTGGQIRTRISASGAFDTMSIYTTGFIHPRGKDA